MMNREPKPSAGSRQQPARANEHGQEGTDPLAHECELVRTAGATPDSRWRNRAEFVQGRGEIIALLTRKWARELDYRLIKEIWNHSSHRIAVRFAYEYRDDSSHWYRAYGNENWQFAADGLMEIRIASINEHPIAEAERKLRWPLGRRPDDHSGLSALGF